MVSLQLQSSLFRLCESHNFLFLEIFCARGYPMTSAYCKCWCDFFPAFSFWHSWSHTFLCFIRKKSVNNVPVWLMVIFDYDLWFVISSKFSFESHNFLVFQKKIARGCPMTPEYGICYFELRLLSSSLFLTHVISQLSLFFQETFLIFTTLSDL